MTVHQITPMVLKRRTVSRLAASHPKLRSMEQKAHTTAINTYTAEILKHLTELEATCKISPQLIQSQPQITIAMRPILFDFLMDVHNRLKLSNQTFFLMINIIDRYCSLRIVRKDHFQLLGLTALWLASKYCDSKHKVPSIEFLRATCCNCYSKNLFVEMESHILKSLNWEVGSPSHDSFIDLLLKENFLNFKPERINDIKYGANYLCQLSQFFTRITFNYSISMISIASVLIMTNSLTLINENQFVHFNTQTNNNGKLNKLCSLMLNVIRENPLPPSFQTKYFKNFKNDEPNNLLSIQHYSSELTTQLYSSIPTTPLYQTPITSRTSSTSSQSSTTSSVMSKNSTNSSLITPPNSCTASPIEFNAGHTNNNSLESNNNNINNNSNNGKHSLHENLKIQCLANFSANYTTTKATKISSSLSQVQHDIERKRTNSWDNIEETFIENHDATTCHNYKKYLSDESAHDI